MSSLIKPMGVALTYSPFTCSSDTITTIVIGYIKWVQGTIQGGQTNNAGGKRREEILPPSLTSGALIAFSLKWFIVRVTEYCLLSVWQDAWYSASAQISMNSNFLRRLIEKLLK